MNVYDGILEFKGTWRNYQERVLNASGRYLADHKVHIVAAPGSGKTTLGIELIRRLGSPCLIFSPTITIRQQWLARITEGFVKGDEAPEGLFSNDLKNMGKITAVTYQALHSAMKHYQGKLEESQEGEEEGEKESREETVDYHDFDVLEAAKKAGIQTICLDEAHHLRTEWWKALEQFIKEMDGVDLVVLTATPPYDSTPAEWKRYTTLCGPIDEEIFTPELVKEGSLCPHQDYVYFNWPTEEEREYVEEYRYQVQVLIQKLLLDQELTQLIASHKGLADPEGYAEKFLDTPGYFSSLLIFCEEQHIPFSDSLRDLIGTRGRLPRLEDKWMEKLLQGFLYDDVDSYPECDGKREEVLTRLKQAGCIYRNKVVLTKNKEINKLLSKSKGKLNSIEKIVETEYNNLGSELRLLILCDFIKKDKLPFVGEEETMVAELGAVPIFEHLRKTQESSVRLGILSGTVVLLPLDIEQDLKGLMEEHSCEGNLIPIRETGYGQLQVKGKNTAVVAVVTELFTQGKINVLVGTKSLLGEGWDAPCINSLILATYVGSFMLSNQMRGRAIRIDRSHPEKTGNIWHLACVFPENEGAKKGAVLTGDYETLVQRFSTFLGLSWEENVIESGLDRLGIPGFNSKVEMDDINAAMLAKASDREAVRARWSQSLKEIHGDMEVEQAQTMEAKQMPKGFVFVNGIKLVILVVLDAMLGFNAYQGGWVPGGGRYSSDTLPVVVIALIMACISAAIASYGVKLFQLGKPDKRMRKVGEAIEKALEEIGEIDASEDHMVKVDTEEGILLNVWLTGGTMRDKSTFAACMEEFWGVIDNPRYLFAPKWRSIFTYSYYSVPEVFARKKDRTQIFEKHMRKVMENYHAIYTRNAEGRKILLEARTRSFVNISQAILNGKKVVKGKYE